MTLSTFYLARYGISLGYILLTSTEVAQDLHYPKKGTLLKDFHRISGHANLGLDANPLRLS